MAGAVLWAAAAAWLYGPVLIKMVRTWVTDPTYSHGFFVLAIAVALIWRRRREFSAAPREPAAAGLVVVGFGLLLFVLGTLAAELFTIRVSLIVELAGTILYAEGRSRLRIVAFPLAFLLLMIPLPAIVFDRIAVSLQLIASSWGERLLQTAAIPVLRDGNVLTLTNATLEVNDACSGIRSVFALLGVALLLGQITRAPRWRQATVALLAIPLAVLLNAVRIAFTGCAVSYFGPAAARGLFHEASGVLVFIVALGGLWTLHSATDWRGRGTAEIECHAG